MATSDTSFQRGLDLRRAGDLTGASQALAEAIAQCPDDAAAHFHLALVYRDLHRLPEAEDIIRRAIALAPADAKMHSALGVILTESGRVREAVPVYADAMRADPTYETATTNWLNAQQYLPGVTAAELAITHARWAARHAPKDTANDFINDRSPHRPLTIGFISPDLARHPVGLLSARLFEHLDRASVRALVFSTRPHEYEDDISRRIASYCGWTTVFGLDDAGLAGFIKNARVDILIDMSGHTAHHRLGLFAHRAAPVQITWLGYTGTTGVPTMDYVLATETLIPAGTDAHYSEAVLRLPHTHACFDPPVDAPAVGPLPADRNGFVTFGCLANPAKISDETLQSFASVLARVPQSRLKLRYKSMSSPDVQARLRQGLTSRGIAPDRILIEGHTAASQSFLETYNTIDLVLDTFPYSGCMTTCEALWMGCPVVTFAGATFAGRQSSSVLIAARLPDLVAPDRAHYEDAAVALAGDRERLRALRGDLRRHLAASPLCDGPRFATDFTTAMRSAWANWCKTRN